MKYKVLTLVLSIVSQIAFAQLITTTPVFPSENQSVEVIFNAAEGNGGLEGYTGDVYAHTGVITNLSSGPSDWKYVKTTWGENTPETKLERIGTNLYKFTTGTLSIRDYYGVPAGEQILQLAFVFRSGVKVGGTYLEGKTASGGDIFAEVYPEGHYVTITQPAEYGTIVQPDQQLSIEASTTSADSLLLYVDDSLITYTLNSSLSTVITTAQQGKHYIKVKSVFGTEVAYDSAYYFIRIDPVAAQMPDGIKDGINYINDSTVILALYVPQKQNVFILGDFNNWEYSTEGFMNKDVDSPYFWKQINGLIPGKEYVYQYKVDEEILVADAYADKQLDPWNDKYISDTTYPNLIQYPYDKTTGYASVLQTAQVPFNWNVTNFNRPAKTDLVIYELLIRDFVATHDYKTLMDTLNYLKNLGVNAIELMPVYEFEGNSSWGYNTAFEFAPDKYYGTKNDLKEFIDICHQQGFAVILDIVLNHVFGSSPFARLYWDAELNRPAADNPWLNPIPKHDFNVGYDFNHESQATKDLVKRVVQYWLTDYHVDGYRFDLSKGFTQKNTLGNTIAWGLYDASRIAIWKNIANEIWATDHDAYIILEHFAENSEEKELANYGMMLWGNLNKQYRQIAMGKADNSDISSLSYKARGWTNPNLVGYMESHDEERMMFSVEQSGNLNNPQYNTRDFDTAINRVAAAAALFYTVPGPKMLWQFGELGYDYSIDYNGRTGEKPIKWDYLNDYRRKFLYNITSALIKLKQENPVFHTSNFTFTSLASSLVKGINLIGSEMSVTVIGNFDITNQNVLPGFDKTGMWYDYFRGDSLNVQSLTERLTLRPGEFRLYTSKKLNTPETGLALPEQYSYNNVILGNVYPNPTSGNIVIPINQVSTGKITLDLYNSSGELVKTLYKGDLTAGDQRIIFTISDFSTGLYYIRLISAERTETVKFMLTK
jgi:1,4-alpha-glucan branching enzyme